ncbi:MAG: TIGR01212 family radical SAM protein [Syntrophomonas sp.]
MAIINRGGKRYRSLNHYLRQKFGEKIFKIPLDAGFTCPNRDGTYSTQGCLFCSARGSGDFAGDRSKSIEEQFTQIKRMMHKKWGQGKYIAYFQAFTNTYAPADTLRQLYETALGQPGVVGIAIATRPDCLPEEVVQLLDEINSKTYLWVELGLQSVHEKSARLLNLHYNYKTFTASLQKLQERKIETCTHIILGLPGESREDMLLTGKTVAALPIQGLKFHSLHLMKDTPLYRLYQREPFEFFSRDDYVKLVVDILEIMPPEVVIHRLTGDSPRELLVEPLWSLKKWEVLNSIDREFMERDSWQGKLSL